MMNNQHFNSLRFNEDQFTQVLIGKMVETNAGNQAMLMIQNCTFQSSIINTRNNAYKMWLQK